MKGLGSDIIEIERIRKAISRHKERFVNALFTPKERQYCYRFADSATHFAGRFAAKEAVIKALGQGKALRISWHEIEIINDTQGKPEVILHKRLLEASGAKSVSLSISHCISHALAVAILE